MQKPSLDDSMSETVTIAVIKAQQRKDEAEACVSTEKEKTSLADEKESVVLPRKKRVMFTAEKTGDNTYRLFVK